MSSRRDLFTWAYYSTPLGGGILPLFCLALSNTDYSVDFAQIALSAILVGLVFSNFTLYFCNVSRETLFTAVSQRAFTCYLHCSSKLLSINSPFYTLTFGRYCVCPFGAGYLGRAY